MIYKYKRGGILLEWTLEHPWMTFFIILSIIESTRLIVKYITGYQDTNASKLRPII